MKENFDASLRLVLKHEGGFVDHPKDPGGATNKGITLNTFRTHFGSGKTVDDLKNITDAQLSVIYKSGYWDKCRCDELPSGVDYAVFDFAVNSGVSRAAKALQTVVYTDVDGVIGPNSLRAVESSLQLGTIDALVGYRLAFLNSLSTFVAFGKGWTRRVREVRKMAYLMALSSVL